MARSTARGRPPGTTCMKDDQQQEEDCSGTHTFDHLLNDDSVHTAAEFHAAVPLTEGEAQREVGFPSERASAGAGAGGSGNALPSALTVFVDPKPKQRAVRSSSSLYEKIAALEAADKENPDRRQPHKHTTRGMPAVQRGAPEGIA